MVMKIRPRFYFHSDELHFGPFSLQKKRELPWLLIVEIKCELGIFFILGGSILDAEGGSFLNAD